MTPTQMLFFATFAFTQASTNPFPWLQVCFAANATLFPKPIAIDENANVATTAMILTNNNF